MNTFFRFFYEFTSIFVEGLVNIFEGIGKGLGKMFGFKEYGKVIEAWLYRAVDRADLVKDKEHCRAARNVEQISVHRIYRRGKVKIRGYPSKEDQRNSSKSAIGCRDFLLWRVEYKKEEYRRDNGANEYSYGEKFSSLGFICQGKLSYRLSCAEHRCAHR